MEKRVCQNDQECASRRNLTNLFKSFKTFRHVCQNFTICYICEDLKDVLSENLLLLDKLKASFRLYSLNRIF